MRDIRQDIQERLELIDGARSKLQAEMRLVDEQSNLLMKLLDIEESRFKVSEPQIATVQPEQAPSDFIVEQVRKRGSMLKDEIKEAMERSGYFSDDGVSAGRSVHFTLLNLEKSGRLRVGDDGRYRVNAFSGVNTLTLDSAANLLASRKNSEDART